MHEVCGHVQSSEGVENIHAGRGGRERQSASVMLHPSTRPTPIHILARQRVTNECP
jgi:hypothetical protein